ncbi:MAG: ATP-binding protein [Phycisphaerae bacterium]
MRLNMMWKFFAAFAFLTIITVVFLACFLVFGFQDEVENKIIQRLQSSTILAGEIFKKSLQEGDLDAIQSETNKLAARLDFRITVIDRDGKVIADSEKDSSAMENHKDRAEFKTAFEKGFGESTRLSQTLDFSMKYAAVCVRNNGEILGAVRIAVPLSQVQVQLKEFYTAVIFGSVMVICIALIISYFLARSISSPIRQMKYIAQCIEQGDFSQKADIKSSDEMSDLASALNKMASELKAKIERLRHMDTVRTDFVANVSHELKTPLTSIQGFIETLEDGAIDDKDNAKRFIEIIKKHAQRLGNIIADLLRLSELESGSEMEMARFDMKDLINEIVMGFGHAVSAKQQRLMTEIPDDDFHIVGNRDRLEQVFVNLIDNSIKYTKQGGTIKVKLALTDGSVAATVEDNGIGIPQNDVERVFERFYRVDKARSRAVGGTGLGLSIAKHIVMAHKGDICIESETNKGTKVIVTISKY